MTTYAETMRAVIRGASKSFVVFEHGTVVILADADTDADLAEAAKELLREYGPVHPGSPAGDFGTLALPDDRASPSPATTPTSSPSSSPTRPPRPPPPPTSPSA